MRENERITKFRRFKIDDNVCLVEEERQEWVDLTEDTVKTDISVFYYIEKNEKVIRIENISLLRDSLNEIFGDKE